MSKHTLKALLEDVSLEKVDGGDAVSTVAVEKVQSPEAPSLMAGLIGSLRAYHLWFHAAHNLTKGTGFAGDHVNLYGKIYVESIELLDAAIEKGVGIFNDEELGCPNLLTKLAMQVLDGWTSPVNQSADEIAINALSYSEEMVSLIGDIAKALDSLEALTYGLDDFLAAAASTHEEYVYLLRQRVKR